MNSPLAKRLVNVFLMDAALSKGDPSNPGSGDTDAWAWLQDLDEETDSTLDFETKILL